MFSLDQIRMFSLLLYWTLQSWTGISVTSLCHNYSDRQHFINLPGVPLGKFRISSFSIEFFGRVSDPPMSQYGGHRPLYHSLFCFYVQCSPPKFKCNYSLQNKGQPSCFCAYHSVKTPSVIFPSGNSIFGDFWTLRLSHEVSTCFFLCTFTAPVSGG